MKTPARILAVDDDPAALSILRRVVEGMGHRVTLAVSRAEARERLRQEDFDALVTDVRMESADAGVRLAAEAHVLRPSLPVILLTGCLDLETALPALRLGACDYLPKPYRLEDLRSAVERALAASGGPAVGDAGLRQELQSAYTELQKVERTREAMLSIVAHELRTPLCGAELAARQIEEEPCTEAGAQARQILKTSLERLDASIMDLLLHTRLSAGLRPPSLAPVDFTALVRDQISAAMREIAVLEESVSFSVSGLERPLQADVELLARALRHLLSNAARFNKPGGRVTVRVEFGATEVDLSVADEGEGIPQEAQARVFDPYYQVADFMTRRAGGLGLGLAIVRRVFEGHGGSVTVESIPGEGSVFRACLPLPTPACLEHP